MKYFIVFILLIFVACGKNNNPIFIDKGNGLEFMYVMSDSTLKTPNNGDGLILNFQYFSPKDSLLFDSKTIDERFRIEFFKPTNPGGINHAFSLLHENDSVVFKIDAQRFYRETQNSALPAYLKKGDKLTFKLRLLQIIDKAEIEKERADFYEQQKAIETRLLTEYLKQNNWDNLKPENGIYYIEIKKGTGKNPVTKQKVTIHYTAQLITGEVFYSTIDKGIPFEFELNSEKVIPGLEAGVEKMRKNGKAMFIIPSEMAYGKEGLRNKIPPFSTLIFEVNLIDIK